MLSRIGTDLDPDVFERLNALIAKEPPELGYVPCAYCEQRSVRRGMCVTHYHRARNHGDPLYERKLKPATCQAPGCNGPCAGVGLCAMHAVRFRRGKAPELAGIVEKFRVKRRRVRKVLK